MTGIIKAAIFYASLALMAGMVLGTVRVVLVVPRIGELAAVLSELPLMLAFSAWAALWSLRRYRLAGRPGALLAMGALAFVFLQAGEILLAGALGPADFVGNIRTYGDGVRALPGLAGLAGQIVFAFLPLLMASRDVHAKR